MQNLLRELSLVNVSAFTGVVVLENPYDRIDWGLLSAKKVEEEFEFVNLLGAGTYGIVQKVQSKRTKEIFALKLSPFQKSLEDEIMALKALQKDMGLREMSKYFAPLQFYFTLSKSDIRILKGKNKISKKELARVE